MLRKTIFHQRHSNSFPPNESDSNQHSRSRYFFRSVHVFDSYWAAHSENCLTTNQRGYHCIKIEGNRFEVATYEVSSSDPQQYTGCTCDVAPLPPWYHVSSWIHHDELTPMLSKIWQLALHCLLHIPTRPLAHLHQVKPPTNFRIDFSSRCS